MLLEVQIPPVSLCSTSRAAQHYMSGELWIFFSSPIWFSKERSGPREARVQTFIFGRRQDMHELLANDDSSTPYVRPAV